MNRQLPTLLGILLPPLLLLGPAVPAAADGVRYLATARATAIEFSPVELIGGPAAIVEQPSHGWLAAKLSGSFVYLPQDEFTGVDQFRLQRVFPGPSEEFDVFVSVAPALIPVAGDWNGDKATEVGHYESDVMKLYLYQENVPYPSWYSYTYAEAEPGWWPFAGDFDGDGFDEVGLYDPSTGVFHLLLLPSHPIPPEDGFNELVRYLEWEGTPRGVGEIPVAGDWYGDGGEDGIGLFMPGPPAVFELWNGFQGMPPFVLWFILEAPGTYPVTGDWDGNDSETAGLYDPATGMFHLLEDHDGGPADEVRTVRGVAGLERLPLAGDWVDDSDPRTSIGLFNPNTLSFSLYGIAAEVSEPVIVVNPEPGNCEITGLTGC